MSSEDAIKPSVTANPSFEDAPKPAPKAAAKRAVKKIAAKKAAKKAVVMKAVIKDATGRVIATAHKKETEAGFPDYIEKAETGAIGRALAMCGYGTLQAPEFDESERLADAPLERKR